MGRTACTEPQCLYSTAIPLLPLWAVRPVQSLSACTTVQFTFLMSYFPPRTTQRSKHKEWCTVHAARAILPHGYLANCQQRLLLACQRNFTFRKRVPTCTFRWIDAGLTVRGCIPGRGNRFFSSQAKLQTVPCVHQVSCLLGDAFFFPGIKRTGR